MVVLWETGSWSDRELVEIDARTPECFLQNKGREEIRKRPLYKGVVQSYLWNADPELKE
jgi:hypothetical protein